jgi:predicted amino acid dehydrogenase
MSASPGQHDFALIGHQDSWDHISRMVHAMRSPQNARVDIQTLREIVPWIPARVMLRLAISSPLRPDPSPGVYIDTFITPDELSASAWRSSIAKVRDALACASREGARIATLGGFTSILLESVRGEAPECSNGVVVTTGNSLTAALVVRGVEQACEWRGIDIRDATVLILGATGDVGSACSRYFASRATSLRIAARNQSRLARLEAELRLMDAADVRSAADSREFLPNAHVIVACTSSPMAFVSGSECRSDAVICDCGYPGNFLPDANRSANRNTFHGGMGRLTSGWVIENPALADSFYRFPMSFVAHGCMLEGMVLALERRFEPFSFGRGNITVERMEEIWEMARRHGVALAPPFNEDGLWSARDP